MASVLILPLQRSAVNYTGMWKYYFFIHVAPSDVVLYIQQANVYKSY